MIAKIGSCCISVGLQSTMSGPAVVYEVSVGKHNLVGPFFGPTAIAEGMGAVYSNLTKEQYADFLLTMNELWPAKDAGFQEKLSQILAELGR